METWVPVFVTSVASVIASSGFWAYVTHKNNARGATDRLLMGLAYDKLTTLGVGYIERGWITKDEYEEYRKYLFDPYKALGGNGVAERIMVEVSNLPLRSIGKYSEILKERRNVTPSRPS